MSHGTGTGQAKPADEHLEILKRIEVSQNTAAKLAARREVDDLLWRAKQDNRLISLEEAVFGSKREPGLKKNVGSLMMRQYLAMGGLVVISACLAWVGNMIKDVAAYLNKK